MNILVLSWRDPKHPQAGGAEQVMHEHMKGWIASNHKVTLFSSKFRGSVETEILNGVKIIRRGNQLGSVYIAAFFWYFFDSHNRFDFIVDQFHGIPFLTPLYIKKPKIAVLQEVTKEVWFKNELPLPLNFIYALIGYFSEPLIFKLYKNTRFMTGSESAKKDLIEMGIKKENITVIPHGVLIKRKKGLPEQAGKIFKEKTKTITYLGALAKDKGVEDAIKAFSLIQKGNQYQFWIIGRGNEKYLKFLKELVKKVGIKNKTIFWGYVSQRKKIELLCKSHLLVNPSIREGWGLVNIEANSCETPVIAYKSPGLIDSVKDNESGIICKRNTPKDIAMNVKMVMENKKIYKKLQKGSIAWSNKFSWKNSQKQSLKLIEKI